MTERKIGDKVKVSSYNDNENYNDFRNKVLIITHIATSTKDHVGYDEGIGNNEALFDFKDEDGNQIPFSLYEYELEDA